MIGWLPAFLNLFLWKFGFSSFGIFVTLCLLLHPASNYCGCVRENACTVHGTFVCLHVLFELLVRSLQSCSDSRKMICGSRFSILRWRMRLFEVRVQMRKLLENYQCVSGCACACFLSVILRYTVSLKMKSFLGNGFWLHVSLSACSLSAKGIHLLLIAVQFKPLVLTVKYNQSSRVTDQPYTQCFWFKMFIGLSLDLQ